MHYHKSSDILKCSISNFQFLSICACFWICLNKKKYENSFLVVFLTGFTLKWINWACKAAAHKPRACSQSSCLKDLLFWWKVSKTWSSRDMWEMICLEKHFIFLNGNKIVERRLFSRKTRILFFSESAVHPRSGRFDGVQDQCRSGRLSLLRPQTSSLWWLVSNCLFRWSKHARTRVCVLDNRCCWVFPTANVWECALVCALLTKHVWRSPWRHVFVERVHCCQWRLFRALARSGIAQLWRKDLGRMTLSFITQDINTVMATNSRLGC